MAELLAADTDTEMATRWRRRRMCILECDAPAPAALEALSARRARLRCSARPAPGSSVSLRHPCAGEISGRIERADGSHVEMTLAGDEAAVGFALAAIAADMTRGR